MAISGSNNISPKGPDGWNPEIMGKKQEQLSASRESSVTNNINETSMYTQEALIRSGFDANYETDLQLNKDKYRKTQDKVSTSPKTKLRGAFSKVKASIRGFTTGFGTRASRISARKAEENGEGRSILPSDLDIACKKGNRISPEMQGFYLDASGMGASTSDISSLSLDSLQSTSMTPIGRDNQEYGVAISGETTLFGASSHSHTAYPVTEETVISWTQNRLSGDIVSSLLEPNVEGASLLRRAPIIDEGMIDISNISKQSMSSDMHIEGSNNTKVVESGSEAGKLETVEYDSSGVIQDSIQEQEKKQARDDLLKDQMALAKSMAELMAAGVVPASLYSYSRSGLATSHTQFPLKISGTIKKHSGEKKKESIKAQSFDNKGTHFSGLDHKGTIEVSHVHHSESEYRFPIDPFNQESLPRLEENVSSSAIAYKENQQAMFSEVFEEKHTTQYNSSPGLAGEETISSAYLFPAFQGVSLLAPLPRSLSEYEQEVEEKKGPGGPPDPLIYQYRNIAIDPPLVFRSPKAFTSSVRFGVQAKPSASSVRDDGSGGRQGGSGNQQEHSQEKQDLTSDDGKEDSIELE